jgi:hypothetical protein
MKTTRLIQSQKRFVQKTLHPFTPKRPLSPAPTARSKNLRPCDKRFRQHQHAECAVKGKTSFISSLLPRLSHLYQKLFGQSEPALTTRTHGTRSNLAFATIKIETDLLNDTSRWAKYGLSIPHYLTTVSTSVFCHILTWQFKQGGTLTQATFEALNSTFKKVPGDVSMLCPITQRYRYRGTDYEVALVQKSCIWLRPCVTRNRNTIPAHPLSASRYTLQGLSPSLVKIPGPTGRTARPETRTTMKNQTVRSLQLAMSRLSK